MNIALSIYRYFPHGGLQRDFLRFLALLCERGHTCRVYTRQWVGEQPAGVELVLLGNRALLNHLKDKAFQHAVAVDLQQRPVDVHLGFNKMPGLDVYFAGDGCVAARKGRAPSLLSRLMGRDRHHLDSEHSVFGADSSTRIFLLNDAQKADYLHHYSHIESRCHVLPPGVDTERCATANSTDRRRKMRAELALEEGVYTLLFVGSRFHTKGLDRAIETLVRVLREQPEQAVRLLVVGADRPGKFAKQAKQLGVQAYVHFLGARDDMLDIMLASDLLLHPPREEAGGIVLLEAIVAGLPIVSTANCGYASHVVAARCGRVLSEPFDADALAQGVMRFIDGVLRADCREAALLYARHTDLHNLHAMGIELLEQWLPSSASAPRD